MTINVPESIVEICRTLTTAGFETVVVGGAVRDSLMGVTPHDWDVATSATPEQVTATFGSRVRSNNGEAHGTVLVLTVDGEPCEVTTFRRDVSCDGRNAVVAFTTNLREDLERRDLTINAIAFDPITGAFTHPANAMSDIERRIIRFVGNGVDRIREDRLRALRAIRFVIQVNGLFAMETVNDIQEAVNQGLLPGPLSIERVRDELLKLIVLPHADDGLRVWNWFGLMDIFLPEVSRMDGVLQNVFHQYDVFEHTMHAIANANVTLPDVDLTTLRMAMLLHDVGKPPTAEYRKDYGYTFIDHQVVGANIALEICNRLRLENAMTNKVVTAVAEHMSVPGERSTTNASWVRRWARRLGDNVNLMLDVHFADKVSVGVWTREAVLEEIGFIRGVLDTTPVVKINTLVNGHDVMRITGEAPGPRIGRILEAVSEFADENPAADREVLLEYIEAIQNLI